MPIKFLNDVAVDSSVLYVDTINNRVGVGTTSPDATLKVQGPSDTATISTSSTPAARINNGGAISLWIGSNFYNYGYVQSIQDDGSNNLKPLSLQPLGGNVGIGTTSPSTLLDVRGEVSVAYDASYGLRFYNDARNNWSFIGNNVSGSSSANLRFGDATGEVMRITGGNVGIGTTSPSHDLTINSATGGQLQFQYNTLSRLRIEADSGGGSYYAAAGFYHRFFTSGAERMRIDSSGNATFAGKIIAEKGVQFTGGTIASATTVLHTNNVVYARGGSGGMFLQNADGSDGIFIANDHVRVDTGSAERMRIDSSGNVGIGTTSPAYPLTVIGQIYSFGGTNNAKNIRISVNDSWGYLTTTAANFYINKSIRVDTGKIGSYDEDLQLQVSGNTKMYVNSSGNVGIGTTSPSRKLDVRGDAQILSTGATGLRIVGGNTDEVYMIFGDADDNSMGGFGYDNNTNELSIDVNNSEAIRIDSFGNVGIGTTSPNEKLVVENLGGAALIRAIASATSVAGIDFGDSANEDASRIRHNNVDNSLQISTSDTERMRITSDGNVGIGTTSPSSRLAVQAAGSQTTQRAITIFHNNTLAEGYASIGAQYTATNGYIDSEIRFGSETLNGACSFMSFATGCNNTITQGSNSEKMRIDSSGNVGIGTTSPTHLLTLETASSPGLKIKDTTQGATLLAFSQDSNSHIGTYSSHPLVLDTNSSERMRITSAGNVGIGTTSPAERFTLQTQGDGLGNEGIFIKNPFAGTTPIVNSKSPFLSLATSTTSAYNSTIYMGRNATATDQESKIEWSNANNGLSIYVKGTGTYREHVRFGDLSSGVPRTYFGGNVGIGTTNPATKLHIGTLSTSGVTTEEFRIQSGTSSGNGGTAIANLVTGSFGTSGIYFGNQSTYTSQDAYLKYADSNNTTTLNFSAILNLESGSSGSRMYINSAGNVGIGTTSPQQKLDVNGDIAIKTATQLSFNTSNGTLSVGGHAGQLDLLSSSIFINYTGDVGIGTTNPGAKLQIDSASLGQNINDTTTQAIFNSANANQSNLYIQDYRTAAGNDWTYSGKRIQEKIDSTWMGYMQFNGDSNNGGISFGTGLSTTQSSVNERMRITSAGNVGIGTSSPSAKLTVVDDILLTGSSPSLTLTDATSSFVIKTNTAGEGVVQTNGTSKPIRFFRNNGSSESMRIDGAGNVGIGTTSPSEKLHVSSNDQSTARIRLSNTNTGSGGDNIDLVAGVHNVTQDGFSVYNATSNQTQLVIQGGGNVGIGTTSPAYQLQLSTNSAAKPTSSAWTVVSDERVKTNIRPYETGLQELLQIEPKLFDYNGKAGFDAKTKNNIGVIAQEIKDVMPETVKKYNAKLNEEDEEDTELYNFDSHALTFALINSVKELNAKIKNLETKIQTLENQ